MNLRLVIPFVAALTLLAQAPSPEPQHVIRVTTRLVEVNVVVRDKDGPVSGLTKGDFTILDRGKPRPIAFFSVNSLDTVKKPAAPLPPNTFTNRLEQRGQTAGNVTVVLFDNLNTEWTDQAYAKQQLVRFLSNVQPQDRIGIYILGTSLRVIQDFTNDSRRLIEALTRYRGETFFTIGPDGGALTLAVSPTQEVTLATQEAAAAGTQVAGAEVVAAAPTGVESPDLPTAPADAGMPGVNDIIDHLNGVISDRMIVDRADTTTAAMEMIAAHVARIPGRKNLIWVSGSFPIALGVENPVPLPPSGQQAFQQAGTGNANREHRLFTTQVTRATRALNNANVAVYPVDARGLVGATRFSAANRAAPIQIGSRPGAITPAGLETMDQMAKFTGGRAFYNDNDITGAVREAVNDAEASYTLGFYPDAGDLDSTFHPIKIQVNRKGLQVRYRQGYLADPEGQPTVAQRDTQIGHALWSALEATGIGLTARLERIGQPRPSSHRIVLDLDLNDIALQPRENRCSLDIVLAQRSPDGREISRISETLEMKFDPARHDLLLKQGLTLTKDLELASNASQLRIVVFDRTSGHIGSLAVPVAQVRAAAGRPSASRP